MTTTRVLIAMVIFVAIVVGGMIYYRYRSVSNLNLPALPDVNKISLTGNTTDGRLTTVENALAVLVNRVNNGSGKVATFSSTVALGSVDSRIQSLENTVANLQVQINQLKSSTTGFTTVSGGGLTVAYIPLGWNGSDPGMSWTSITSQSISIDPADYPGYKSMQFEANLGIYQGNGTGYARLFNKDDDLAIIPSEISSTSNTYSWVSSSTFQLSATTKKTYILQLKTTTGYNSQIQNARIKVNF